MRASHRGPIRRGGPILRLLAAGLLVAAAASDSSHATEGAERIAVGVLDFNYVDTSGEVRDQSQEHAARLKRFSQALRSDLTRSGRYRIVVPECSTGPCTSSDSPGELVARSQEAGAKLVVVGAIHKMSTLVQWAKVEVIDADAGRVILDRLLTFRGDSDEAWQRAEAFLAHDLEELRSP